MALSHVVTNQIVCKLVYFCPLNCISKAKNDLKYKKYFNVFQYFPFDGHFWPYKLCLLFCTRSRDLTYPVVDCSDIS